MEPTSNINIKMVVKIQRGGILCRKCRETKEFLKNKGYWDKINEIIEIEEDAPDSDGWRLAKRFNIERAPFFIVMDGDKETVYSSVLKLEREVFKNISK